MISANSLVFPKPKLTDPKPIQKNLVYIPRDMAHKHYYPYQNNNKITDDLTCAGSPTSHSLSQYSQNICRFKSIRTLKSKPKNAQGYIPCVYLRGSYHQTKLIIYFHSNAEDIITAHQFISSIHIHSGRSILMMQYPGYSLYQNTTQKQFSHICKSGNSQQTTAQDIEHDAKKVVQYMKQSIGYNLKDITIMGRSIGSGPAVYVASIYSVAALILISPFLSLQDAVKDLYGQICGKLIKQRFNNKERVKMVNCPSLIIHGMEDKIIPYFQSVALNKEFKTFSVLKIVQKMRHNSFNLHKDFLIHVKEFLRNLQLQQ